MKYRSFIFSVVATALIVFGCGQEELVSPQLTQSEQGAVLAKAVNAGAIKGPFMATVDLSVVTDEGEVKIVDGKLKVRGQVNEGPFIPGDIEGTATVVTDFKIDLATGNGPGHGTFTFKVTKVKGQVVSGEWTGRFEGQFGVSGFSGNFNGEGGGDLEDTTIKGTFTDAPIVDGVFELTGRIKEDDD